MKCYDFLLVIENKVREIDYCCLIKYALNKKGYSAHIVSLNDLRRRRKLTYQVTVLVVTSCWVNFEKTSEEDRIISYKKVVQLKPEQLISQYHLSVELNSRNVSEIKNKELVTVAWGDKYADMLTSTGIAKGLYLT